VESKIEDEPIDGWLPSLPGQVLITYWSIGACQVLWSKQLGIVSNTSGRCKRAAVPMRNFCAMPLPSLDWWTHAVYF
jgi:hypothetical protein